MLTPAGVLLVLSSVDLRGWGARGRLVAAVGAGGELGAPAGYRPLAEHCGLEPRWAWKVLGLLVRERVLVQIPGAGRRPPAWWVNADVRAWAGVPWAVPVEAAELRLFHVQQGDGRGATGGVVPRSYVAALARVVPRSYVAAFPGVVPRSRGAAQGESSRRGLERGATAAPAPVGFSSSSEADSSSSSGGAGEVVSREVEQAVRRAVMVKTGAAFLAGRPMDLLRETAAEHGLDAVLLTVDAAPVDLRAPKLCEWVHAMCPLPAEGEEAPPAPAAPTPAAAFFEGSADRAPLTPEERAKAAAAARAARSGLATPAGK